MINFIVALIIHSVEWWDEWSDELKRMWREGALAYFNARGCIKKFPDGVDKETTITINTR
jgi:hypothetical protein